MKSYNFLTSGIDFKNIDINDVIVGMKVQTSTTLIVDEIILKIEHSFRLHMKPDYCVFSTF